MLLALAVQLSSGVPLQSGGASAQLAATAGPCAPGAAGPLCQFNMSTVYRQHNPCVQAAT